MSAPLFAVAFAPREKFGWSLAALKRLYAHFGVPFTLYLVDCGYPPAVRAELDAFLRGRDNVELVETPQFLTAEQALNLVLPRMREAYLYAINNDVLIEPGLGECTLQTLRETGAALLTPRILEIWFGGEIRGHHDDETSCLIVEEERGLRVEVPDGAAAHPLPPVRRVHHFETHALAFTRAAAQALAPFPGLHCRHHIDLAVHAWRLGLPVYTDERVACAFVLPPIRDYDLPYFRYRWNAQAAYRSQEEVARRWNITGFPYVPAFIDNYAAQADPGQVQTAYADTCEYDDYPAVFARPGTA